MKLNIKTKVIALVTSILTLFTPCTAFAECLVVEYQFPVHKQACLFLENAEKRRIIWTSCRSFCILKENLDLLENMNGKKIEESNPYYKKIQLTSLQIDEWLEEIFSEASDEWLDKHCDSFKERRDKDNDFIRLLGQAFGK